MSTSGFPTSSDIWLEANDRKIAVVQGYKVKASRSSKNIEAFGELEPVATIEGQRRYTIEISRLYATDDAISDGIDFFSLYDFSLVIVKPDKRIVYSGCQWSDIEENGELGEMVSENVTIIATKRVETA